MNIGEDDEMWTARLDAETAGGADACRRGLSPRERDLLAKEAALEAKIAERLAAGGECPDEVWERTRLIAREPDHAAAAPAGRERGEPNRLADETSPYLLQHAHNPVDWYPWGDDAFARARRENKPVFLSIGYSSCHWCHVMAHESFEDAEVARSLNERFVSVKVDREERPDVDAIYMVAVQLTTGRGGWPLSAFLTPEGRPFFAGTYFPREDLGGRTGFKSLLRAIDETFRTRRAAVEESAKRLSEAIADHLSQADDAPAAPLDRAPVENAVSRITEAFDSRRGGFGSAPKFPPHGELRLLLSEYRRAGDEEILRMVTGTLDAMARGGVRDHVGGGFHRYATDAAWLVPHFEKMLYDNAQLLRAYAEAFAITGDDVYAEVAKETAAWVLREMVDEAGGFHSALDADSEGEEGAFYVWTADEIARALGSDAQLFARAYGVEAGGNYEDEATGRPTGANILHAASSPAQLAAAAGADEASVRDRLREARERLLAARARRTRPGLDDKVLAGWNGLMIGALAYAGRHLDEDNYLDAARAAARFVLARMRRDGRLLRTYRDGEARRGAYLDDYAMLADGLLELHRATGEASWLSEARDLADVMLARYADDEGGGLFFTADDHERLLARSKEAYDHAVPSGNGVAARVLIELFRLTGDGAYARAARRTLEAYLGEMRRVPRAMTSMLAALASYVDYRGDARAESGVVVAEAYASALRAAPGGSIQAALRITVRPGWHINASAPTEGHLAPTRVSLERGGGASLSSVSYPEPVEAPLTGTTWMAVELDLAGDATGADPQATLRVSAQPCNDRECLAPVELELPLHLGLGDPGDAGKRHAWAFALAAGRGGE